MQRAVGCRALEPEFLTLAVQVQRRFKEKWDLTYLFLMATQFLLKLNVNMQYEYKHDNINIPTHFKQTYLLYAEGKLTKILSTVSRCVAMQESTWRALSFGAELLHAIHVGSRPRTAQPRDRGSIPGTEKT